MPTTANLSIWAQYSNHVRARGGYEVIRIVRPLNRRITAKATLHQSSSPRLHQLNLTGIEHIISNGQLIRSGNWPWGSIHASNVTEVKFMLFGAGVGAAVFEINYWR